MIKVSLTDFMDYISKSGVSKFNKVKQVKFRDKYHPAFDFWKPLRDNIIDIHESEKDKNELNKLIDSLTDKKKLNRYPSVIKQYLSFLGRKKIKWFDPPYENWEHEELSVRLNPELGLIINNKKYAIKLHLKAEKLSQMKVDLILFLMNEKLKKGDYSDIGFAILDLNTKKLFTTTKLDKSHIPLLEGEASGFITIWNGLKTK